MPPLRHAGSMLEKNQMGYQFQLNFQTDFQETEVLGITDYENCKERSHS